MGDSRVVWMLAVLCSMIANTSQDAEGKAFVYRKSSGAQGRIAAPDPTMMRPEDFLPNPSAAVAEESAHGGMPQRVAEDFIEHLKAMGALDQRKQRRDTPRLT